MEFGWKKVKFPFQTWFWINRRILYIEMPFSYIKLFNWENIGYVAYPPEALFWSLKEDKYIHCRWMTSFVYLRNLATSDIPISGFPGWILALNCLLQIEQERSEEGRSVGDALALAFLCARFCSASLILFALYSPAPFLMRPRHFARSCAICYHDSVGMLKSLREDLNLYQQLGSNNLTGWKVQVGVAS